MKESNPLRAVNKTAALADELIAYVPSRCDVLTDHLVKMESIVLLL
jgi:hypothetical protein